MQAYSVYAQQSFFRHYTTKEGLAHDITYQIIQDSKGYIWVGTDDGLSRFNGAAFKTYSYENGLKSNYVIDIVEHQPNDFLIATWGEGVHRLHYDSISRFSFGANEGRILKTSKITKANDSVFYTLSMGTLEKYNIQGKVQQKMLITYPKSPTIKYQFGVDEQINVKVKSLNNHVYLLNNETSNNPNTALKGLYILRNDSLIPIHAPILKDKLVYGITSEDSLNTYVSAGNTIYHFRKNKLYESLILDLPEHVIFNLEMIGNTFYFITYNRNTGAREAYSFNKLDSTLVNFNTQLGITALVSDVLIDRNNTLWITTYGQGVYSVPETNTKFLGKSVFNSPDLKDILALGNTLYTLSPNRLYALKSDSIIESVSIPFHVEDLQVDTLKSTLGLITTNKFEEKSLSSGLKVKSVWGRRYRFSYQSQALEFENNFIISYLKGQLVDSLEAHHLDSHIRKAIQHNNRVYVIYDRVGVFVFDLASGKLLERWNKKNGHHTNNFYDIIVHNNTFWLASDMGLIVLKDQELIRFTTHDGLLSNHINDLFIDHHDILWIGTQKGLNVKYGSDFYNMSKSKGQQSSFITKIIEHNNVIYATGNNGLFLYDNSNSFAPNSSTRLLITQNKADFQVDVINYNNPESIILQYQVNGEDWQQTRAKHINFTQLKQGNYKLQFRVKDATSAWEYSNVFSFQLRDVWYKQTIFYILCISLFFVGVIVLVYKRLKASQQLNKRFQEALNEKEKLQQDLRNVRHQIAKDFHDDLGNKLASISITSNLLLKQKEDYNKKSYKRIQQIHEDANTLYGGMRDFMWTLNHKHNTLNELQLYLSEFGEQLFEDSEIVFKSNHNIPEQNIDLPYYWNKQLVLIFKETFTNSYKHSNASEVVFTIDLRNESLSISVADNGIGFNEQNCKHLNGIKNMKERASSIKGDLTISSSSGTLVSFNTIIKSK